MELREILTGLARSRRQRTDESPALHFRSVPPPARAEDPAGKTYGEGGANASARCAARSRARIHRPHAISRRNSRATSSPTTAAASRRRIARALFRDRRRFASVHLLWSRTRGRGRPPLAEVAHAERIRDRRDPPVVRCSANARRSQFSGQSIGGAAPAWAKSPFRAPRRRVGPTISRDWAGARSDHGRVQWAHALAARCRSRPPLEPRQAPHARARRHAATRQALNAPPSAPRASPWCSPRRNSRGDGR